MSLTYTMGQKLSSKLLFIYSPTSDRFYIFYISQGSVATHLRCGGMFSNNFIINFPQNAPVKKFWQSVNIWQRYGQNFVAYFLGHPVDCLFNWKIKRSFIRLITQHRTQSWAQYIISDYRWEWDSCVAWESHGNGNCGAKSVGSKCKWESDRQRLCKLIFCHRS